MEGPQAPPSLPLPDRPNLLLLLDGQLEGRNQVCSSGAMSLKIEMSPRLNHFCFFELLISNQKSNMNHLSKTSFFIVEKVLIGPLMRELWFVVTLIHDFEYRGKLNKKLSFFR